uniref:Structural maintenance of chromosomes protein n=1 Tax=Panagrolaimus sp. PS1159 TaxID=55785 RepID=A0AC35F533_9BILA
MYIKTININGFRSYREKTTIENIARQFNVVVGQNGSGKSNFFAAIQFVLSQDFSHLSSEDRQSLLHEGTGSRAPSATVELIFDNSDKRLSAFEGNEFSISRTVSAKKDQYFIDGHIVTRGEITNLMESAGFSRSNPYYIVKQGKIAELATATDLARLKLLREVAGTRIYDEKKQESLKMLEETKEKMEKSVLLLEFMNKRLKTLESEKEELKEYQKYDKLRRALEYTLLKTEVNDCKKEFDNLSKQRQDLQATLNDAEKLKFEYSKKISALEADLRSFELREKRLSAELSSIREEESRLESDRALATLESNDLKDQVNNERAGRQAAEQRLEEIQVIIKAKEQELEEIKPRYNELVEQQNVIFGELNNIKRKRNELYSKTGGDKGYKTAEERDRELNKKIMLLNQRIEDLKDNIERFTKAYENEREMKAQTDNRIQEIETKIEENITRMDELSSQDDDFRKRIDDATRIFHEKQLQHKEVTDQLAEQEDQFSHVETSFYRMLPKSVAEGIRNMNTIIEDLRERNTNGKYNDYINGYHGIVIKLMSAEHTYFKALEVTAGSTLTHHVVDNERHAMFFLEEINKRRMTGQCTFFALNRVYAPEQRPLRDRDGRHLLGVVKYDGKFSSVFRSMFGGTILVKDIQTGRKIARNEQFNCITFDGDEVNYSGPMTGGYVDSRKSRLDTMEKLKMLEPHLEELKKRAQALSKECIEKENLLADLRMNLLNNEQQRNTLQREHNNITAEKRELFELNNRLRRNMENKDRELIDHNHSLHELEARRNEMQAQIGTPLTTTSSSQEARKLTEIEALFKTQSAKAEEILNKVADLNVRKMELENELGSKLYRQREDLKMQVTAINLEVKRHELQTRSVEAEKMQRRIAEIYERNLEVSEELDGIRDSISKTRENLDKFNDEKADADGRVSSCTSDIELIRRRMAECNKRREDTLRRVKDLGTLAVDITSKFGNLRRKELEAQWMDSLNHMKKFKNVNKKALDQFVRSTTERDNLHSQIEEMQENYQRINALIEASETRKFDALYLTFKQVAKNFHDVFKKLVPNGVGDLIMKTAPVDNTDAEAVERVQTTHVMERFIGVGIRVNFSNDSNEGCRELFHLSGGQKTLVALALIFAIQKCDPAPFYLFDEIDAALDQEKRRAVAKLIDEFSTNAQFIATTFRPEMLEYASKCYGVRFRNKVSYITIVNSSEALQFLSLDEGTNQENPDDVEMAES